MLWAFSFFLFFSWTQATAKKVSKNSDNFCLVDAVRNKKVLRVVVWILFCKIMFFFQIIITMQRYTQTCNLLFVPNVLLQSIKTTFACSKCALLIRLNCGFRETLNANNRYLNWAETYYKICYLLFAPNVLSFRKIGGTHFAKSKIQRMSSNFVHCM